MAEIDDILSETKHRPYVYPKGRWTYYQEWNNALFLHWKVPFDLLRELVPEKLHIDIFDGHAYVSLVAFTMQKIRPRSLPAIKPVSDFDEINIRTYIDNDHKKGVYFLNIEAGKRLSAFVARNLSGLPYEKSDIFRSANNYRSANLKKEYHLDVEFVLKQQQAEKLELDHWLTERYCLYLDKGETIYRYDIHHREWQIKTVALKRLKLNYKIGQIELTTFPDITHYSDGVKVIAWKRRKI